MSLALILGSTTAVFAAPNNKEQPLNAQGSTVSGNLKIGSNQEGVSDVLTFDQIVDVIAKDYNISKEEASKQVIGTNLLGSSNKTDAVTNSVSANYLAALSATYRTATSVFAVNAVYSPYLKFYCQTTEGGGFW